MGIDLIIKRLSNIMTNSTKLLSNNSFPIIDKDQIDKIIYE
jgi:hypothetical protein